jgi:hypothetical protein
MPNKAPRVFFRNYDHINDPTGPGTGLYKNMDKYKSVSDFRKRKKRIKQRKKAYLQILAGDNNNLFDPYEDQGITPLPYAPAEPGGGISGMLDGITPKEDVDGKSPYNLYYGVLETHFADDADEADTELLDKPNESPMSQEEAFKEIKHHLPNRTVKEFVKYYGNRKWYKPYEVEAFIDFWSEYGQ